MAIGKDIKALESKLGYNFMDLSYLENALTHSSYTNEQRSRGINAVSNERLEFLGDAVLEEVISEILYFNFKKYREGALTKLRQRIVCEATLASIADSLSLGEYLNLGRGEELTDCRRRPKILADALEALIAAVYLDSRMQGNDKYRDIVKKLFEKKLDEARAPQSADCKTRLQQLIEQDGSAILEYKIIDEVGPEHNKQFTVVAYINNNEVGRGTAGKVKLAEMEAAKMALRLFGASV